VDCDRLADDGRMSLMATEYISDLKKWVAELVRKREAGGEIGLNRAVDLISKHYAIHHHEVAIFVLSEDGRFLRFVVPEKLQAVGQIPLTSTNSLAARTARDKRPEIINHFSVVPHASVFEAVPLVEEQRGDPIQKIMSAPMMFEKKLIGVIQISRKAKSAAEAGPDFTHAELRELKLISDAVAPCIPLCIHQ
jgi:GAF domain-containing protein